MGLLTTGSTLRWNIHREASYSVTLLSSKIKIVLHLSCIVKKKDPNFVLLSFQSYCALQLCTGPNHPTGHPGSGREIWAPINTEERGNTEDWNEVRQRSNFFFFFASHFNKGRVYDLGASSYKVADCNQLSTNPFSKHVGTMIVFRLYFMSKRKQASASLWKHLSTTCHMNLKTYQDVCCGTNVEQWCSKSS